eukprot:superscaffoldBa00006942_g22057
MSPTTALPGVGWGAEGGGGLFHVVTAEWRKLLSKHVVLVPGVTRLRLVVNSTWFNLGHELRFVREGNLKGSLQGVYQRRLYKELMRNYNPLERPVSNDSHSLTVHFSFSLLQIMDV